jgi:hypothetical protein
MATHKGPASLRPRCTRSGSSVAAIPVYQSCCMVTGLTVCKAPYILSVKPSDFTVWRHTRQKNGVNCAVLIYNSAGLWTVLSRCLSHRELRSSLRESHSFLTLPADTTMVSSQATQPQHQFLAIHSADEHYMIYSFSNTISYSTFYAFFSSFRITLWPMWLANSKRQPCLRISTIVIRTSRHTELTKKLMGNLCCVW